eukprot:scaffold75484_cov44-Cyclotella_meneghiniana.AAC.1
MTCVATCRSFRRQNLCGSAEYIEKGGSLTCGNESIAGGGSQPTGTTSACTYPPFYEAQQASPPFCEAHIKHRERKETSKVKTLNSG